MTLDARVLESAVASWAQAPGRSGSREPRVLWATDLAGCPAHAFFSALFVSGGQPAGTAEAMLGRLVHASLESHLAARLLGDLGVETRSEHVLSAPLPEPPGWRVVGRPDLLVDDGGRVWVVEIKTVRSLDSGLYERGGVRDVWAAQVAVYAALASRELVDKEFSGGFLVVVPRTGQVDPVVAELGADELVSLGSRLLGEAPGIAGAVEDAWRGGKPVVPRGPRWGWECRLCPYRLVCPYAGGAGGDA